MASNNYAKRQAQDETGIPIQNTPTPFKATAQFYKDNLTASSIQTLTDNTTRVEVGGVVGTWIRWIPATETAAAPAGSVLATNFDHYIPPNTVRWFVVPKETQGITSIVGVNVQNGLYKRMAVGPVGPAGSVLTTEY